MLLIVKILLFSLNVKGLFGKYINFEIIFLGVKDLFELSKLILVIFCFNLFFDFSNLVIDFVKSLNVIRLYYDYNLYDMHSVIFKLKRHNN